MKCQLANITVHYETVGQGKPFITISGAPSDHRIISSWMEPLFNARSGWQRFYFDLPGTGQTRGADWIRGADQMLDVICDFIDAVIPGQQFALLGLSAGGHYARGVAYRKPGLVNGLCLLVPWLSDHQNQSLPASETFVEDPALFVQLPPREAETFNGLVVIQNQKILDWYREVVMPARQGADWEFLERMVRNWQFSFAVDAQPFEKPTLIVTGRQDTHVGYQDSWDVLERYPRATFVVIDRAGHALGVEQESLFHVLVNEWLDRVEENMAIRASESEAPPAEIQPRYPEGYWDSGADYLQLCRILQHNDDYLEFLVTRVWRLDQTCRLAEFGCGFGKMGLQLMPLLAQGSTYTGIDQSSTLVAKGRQLWANTPWQAEFYEGNIYETPFADHSFDVAMTHTVLMHVPYPEKVLQEMIRVTRPGGLVIACEANRNAHTAMLHIEEVNHQEAAPLGLFQTINRGIRERTGVDHNIGAKLPVLMHRAGLKQVQIRVSDAARFLCPPLDTDYKRKVFEAICDEGYGQPKPSDEQRERWKANLMSYGISEQDAEAEIARELDEDFLNKGQQYHTVYVSLLTWSFGVV